MDFMIQMILKHLQDIPKHKIGNHLMMQQGNMISKYVIRGCIGTGGARGARAPLFFGRKGPNPPWTLPLFMSH